MPGDPEWDGLRDQIIGLGGASARKSYYPELQRRLTELEQARERLEESETYLRAILDTVSEAVFIHDAATGEVLDVNQGMCRMYGYTLSEARALTVGAISSGVPPFTQEAAMRWIGRATEGGPQRFEWQARTRDGRVFWVEIGMCLTVLRGQPRVLVTATDIDEHKRAEEDLLQIAHGVSATTGARFFSTLALHLAAVLGTDSVLIADLTDARSGVARACAAVLDGALLPAGDAAIHGLVINSVARDGHLEVVSGAATHYPGDPLVAQFGADGLAAVALTTTAGAVLGVIVVMNRHPLSHLPRIVTTLRIFASRAAAELERQVAEEEKRALNDQLLQSQKLESIGRLAGGVAHDFNNMLSVIVGHVEQAIDQVRPDDPLCADLLEIQQAALRSAELTGQLLAFARKQTIVPQVLGLDDAVGGMFKMLRRLIGEHVKLDTRLGGLRRSVRIDPSQLNQLLTNLCVNARDAVGSAGQVTISTSELVVDDAYCADHPEARPGEYCVLAVTDTGVGMDRETMAHLFEPFYTTKRLGEGTGLGLATVYGIVHQNSGFITVASQPHQGATFQVFLPCHADLPAAADDGGTEATVRPVGGTETILLVEDEAAILRLLRRTLTGLGYHVLVADTPSRAVALADEHSGSVDLLMTDMVMPEMNGRELARALRERHATMPVLFISGYAADAVTSAGELDGGAFLQKPFDRAQLAGKVRAVLDAPGASAP